MNQKGKQFESERKGGQYHRASALRSSHSKIIPSTTNQPLPTTISQSVKVKEPSSE